MKTPLEVLNSFRAHDYTLHDAFMSRAEAGPERPFLTCRDRQWSWGAFGEKSDRIARALMAKGIRKGDRVALCARNSDYHALLLFALARIGAVIVPVNPEFGPNEVHYILNHAEVSAVAASADTLKTVQEASAKLSHRHWIALLDEAHEALPSLDALSNAPEAARGDFPAVSADDTCVIIYTSGTTGFPKGVMHSQRVFVTTGEVSVERLNLQPDDRAMIVLPMFHINALFYSLSGVLASGSQALILPAFSASTFWQSAADYGATWVKIIEAIGTILKERPRSEFRPDHKIRIIYGPRQHVIPTFRNEFKIADITGGFGMGQIPRVTVIPPSGPEKPATEGKNGRHPDPNREWAQCRIVDDAGNDLPDGETGEFWVKTPNIMQGYFRDPEMTKASFSGDWFMTGDLVRRDADGYYYFVSRKKDIIRRRGENIAGAEIDRIIAAHPAVHEVAAIGVPSELGEEEILVAIVLKPGHTLTPAEVRDWCRERLAALKIPRFVVFVDEIPHTATHKIAKAMLKKDETLVGRADDAQAGKAKTAAKPGE